MCTGTTQRGTHVTWPFKGHQTLEENKQHGLRGNIKVKKIKKGSGKGNKEGEEGEG